MVFSAMLAEDGGVRPSPETLINVQVTRHDWLKSLLGDGRQYEVKECSVRKIIFYIGPMLEKPRQDVNLSYQHDEPNEPTKEGSLSFVLLEFASV